MNLPVILNAFGVALGMFLFARYQLWKASRPIIHAEERNGVYVPDGRLLRWERRIKWGFILMVAALFPLAYLILTA